MVQIVSINDITVLPDYLYKINKNRLYNRTLVSYYEKLKTDDDFDNFLNLDNKIESIDDCYKYFQTKVYKNHLIKSLERTNLCKDKFCRNCKKVKQANRSEAFTPELEKYRSNLYHLILTVPNCDEYDLKMVIKKMFKAFPSLIRYFNGFKKATDLDFDYGYLGAVRSLEITFKNYSKDGNNYHPHLHCAVVWNDDLPVINKTIYNSYSYSVKKVKKYNPDKRKMEFVDVIENNPFSEFEILVQKVWRLLYDGVKVTRKNVDNLKEGYSCKINKFQDDDYAELFKYMIKEVDEEEHVLTYEVFKTLLVCLHKVRQIQGYGCFYGLKNVDDKDIFKSDEEYSKLINMVVEYEKPVDGYESTKNLFFDHKYRLVTKKKMFTKVLEQYNNDKEKN